MATIGQTVFRFTGALLLGGIAVTIDRPSILEAPGAPNVPVVIATRDISAGGTIDRGSVDVAHWPSGTVPAGGFASIDSVAGRVAGVAVYKGEALVPGRLAPRGTDPRQEIRITAGKRAFGLRVNNDAYTARLIQPNSRVDIMLVVDGGREQRVAKLFMPNMRVLAIGAVPQRTEAGRAIDAVVVTVEVTRAEAERLAIAMTQGQIHLVLRGYGDPTR